MIAPESCSTILFKTRERKEEATNALKLTAEDLEKQGIIDRIVPEPFGGAHRDYDQVAASLKSHVREALAELRPLPPDELVRQRIGKFAAMSKWKE